MRWNPLSYINRRDPVEVINELQKIAAMLYPDPLTGEKFWAEGARTAFLGIAAYIAATIDDGEDALPFTLGEVYRQFAAGDAQRRFPKIIADRKKAGKPLSEGCLSAIKDYTGSSANTFSGLRQSVTSKINGWLNPYVDAATSESDFDLSDFRDTRISLYLGVSPDDLDRVAPIYGLLFQQLIDRNVRELPKGDRHQIKVLLALDEFAASANAPSSRTRSAMSPDTGCVCSRRSSRSNRSRASMATRWPPTSSVTARCGLSFGRPAWPRQRRSLTSSEATRSGLAHARWERGAVVAAQHLIPTSADR